MQVTITADQIRVIRDFAEPFVIGALVWFAKRTGVLWLGTLEKKLNGIITDNTNRNRDELIEYSDKRFKEHEDKAFAKITAMERRLDEMHTQLEAVNKLLVEALRR